MKRNAISSTILLLTSLAIGCQNSTTDPGSPHSAPILGRIEGTVTIGPNCPVQQPSIPCPTPPAAYAARKVEIWDSGHRTLLRTENIDAQGQYGDLLPPGTYVVDLRKNGIDRSADVPKSVTIVSGEGVRVDINIDTGIR